MKYKIGISPTFNDFSDSYDFMLKAKDLSELIILVVVTSWLLRRTHFMRKNLILMTFMSLEADASVSNLLKTRALQRLKMIQLGIVSILPRIICLIFVTLRDFFYSYVNDPDNITWFICTNRIPFCIPVLFIFQKFLSIFFQFSSFF